MISVTFRVVLIQYTLAELTLNSEAHKLAISFLKSPYKLIPGVFQKSITKTLNYFNYILVILSKEVK